MKTEKRSEKENLKKYQRRETKDSNAHLSPLPLPLPSPLHLLTFWSKFNAINFIWSQITAQLKNPAWTSLVYFVPFSFFTEGRFRRVSCEGQQLTINCGSKEIDILSASYGRTHNGVCGRSGNTNCHSGISMREVMYECQGQPRCTLHAKNSAFGEPCAGVHKYLEVCSSSYSQFAPEKRTQHYFPRYGQKQPVTEK